MKTYTTKLLLILILALDSNQTYAQDSYNNLIAPEGFHVELFASDILAPRQMAEGKDFIFVGGIKGQIFAVSKINPKQKILIASELNNSRGVALNNGDLYFAEVDKIWVIRDIEKLLDSDPDKTLNYELFNDDLPSDAWHGGKWIKFGSDGNLYTNVGAPCNICDDGFTKDSRYASIIKLHDKSWKTVARGVRNSVGFDWHPQTDNLYFGDNGRDWLGDDSPSCELNIL
jgi:glucose/arabinose dehydrogenase